MPGNAESVAVEPVSGYDVAVLVVDDQPSFRQALRDLIAHARGFVLVGEAASGEEAAAAVAALSPQLVLMDVMMPGIGGIAAARLILKVRMPPVVVLISIDDPARIPEVQTLGGKVAFLRKQELRPPLLRELWEMHRTCGSLPAHAASPDLGDARVHGGSTIAGDGRTWGGTPSPPDRE